MAIKSQNELNEDDLEELREIEEQAKLCQDFLLSDINVEKGAIEKSHSLHDKLMSVDSLLTHIHFSGIQSYRKLYALVKNLADRFQELQITMSNMQNYELHVVKEEQSLQQKIKEEISHKKWKLVWKTSTAMRNFELKELRMDIKMIERFLGKLKELSTIIQNDEHILIEEEKIIALKHNDSVVKELDSIVPFFHTLYQFIVFYETLFDSMLRKEKSISNSLSSSVLKPKKR